MRSWAVCLLSLPALALGAQDNAPDPNPVDQSLASLWADRGVAPAAPASDPEFLRRVTLDLTGDIPAIDDARAFESGKDPDKRAKKIDELMASDAFLDFWSGRLTNALLGYSRDFEYVTNRRGFADWMRRQLAEDRGWDQIVSDVLTASGEPRKRPEVSFLAQFIDFSEGGRYGLKIEELTGKISTAFLGIRLRCAQCHDHPFDKYTQEDFFGMVAFFQKTGTGQRGGGRDGMSFGIKTHRQPLGYKFEHWARELAPRFLDGPPPETENLRVEFTEVLTRHDQFVRAFVNRVWACLFGRGIVDPYDDFGPRNRPVAPELLEELAARARSNRMSVRWLVRTIVTSQTYQRTSRATPGQDAKEQERLFARSRVRPLAPEQLWNAIARATDLKGADLDRTAIRRLAGVNPVAMQEVTTYDMLRSWFLGMLVRTANPDAPAALGTYTTNVQQVLYAMNARSPIWSGIRAKGSGRLDRLVLYQDDPEVILQELFLGTLGRPPREAERKRCLDTIPKRAGESKDDHLKKVERAWEVIFWAILNTDEFIFNH